MWPNRCSPESKTGLCDCAIVLNNFRNAEADFREDAARQPHRGDRGTDRLRTVSDIGSGYWLMVSGLSPGEHTLPFGGAESTGFSTRVTDQINVVRA